MPTHNDETLLERYQREHQVYEGMMMSKAKQLADFPARIVQTLEDMADREPKGNRGPWQYSDGDQMQDDAEAFLKELRRLFAINAELIAKTTLVLRSFPTDSDMLELGWTQAEVDEACNAYDDARAAIAKAQGEQP
ncbi:MAG: hypothetical protein WC829_03170 [Hyphomicrobium sp.]|jgi:hypothetical protein